jgi:hypothetical protein
MTLGCHTNTKTCTVQLKFSPKKTQEYAGVTHEAIQKCIHINTSALSTYAFDTGLKWVSQFLDNRRECVCVFKSHYSAILNRAFSFIRPLKSDGRLLRTFIQE